MFATVVSLQILVADDRLSVPTRPVKSPSRHSCTQWPSRLLPVYDTGVDAQVDALATELHEAGAIDDPHSSAPFRTRLIEIERQFPSASVLLHKNGVLHPSFAALWSCDKMLDVAEQVLGPDIDGHPVWNLRCKTPYQEQSTVPWHQDTSYLNESCWSSLQLTAWVPLLDTSAHNGCMQVVSGADRTGRTAEHTCCVGGTWYTELTEEEIARTLEGDMENNTVTCEVPLGSVLFLNNLIPHRSTENSSNHVRWSLDLRWQRAGEKNGFDDVKSSIPMRRANDPDRAIQWEEWATEDRESRTAMPTVCALNQRALQCPYCVCSINMPSSHARVVCAQSTCPPLRCARHTGIAGAIDLVKDAGPDAPPVGPGGFDTTVAGPWMLRWDVVNHNRHTASMGLGGAMGKA